MRPYSLGCQVVAMCEHFSGCRFLRYVGRRERNSYGIEVQWPVPQSPKGYAKVREPSTKAFVLYMRVNRESLYPRPVTQTRASPCPSVAAAIPIVQGRPCQKLTSMISNSSFNVVPQRRISSKCSRYNIAELGSDSSA